MKWLIVAPFFTQRGYPCFHLVYAARWIATRFSSLIAEVVLKMSILHPILCCNLPRINPDSFFPYIYFSLLFENSLSAITIAFPVSFLFQLAFQQLRGGQFHRSILFCHVLLPPSAEMIGIALFPKRRRFRASIRRRFSSCFEIWRFSAVPVGSKSPRRSFC